MRFCPRSPAVSLTRHACLLVSSALSLAPRGFLQVNSSLGVLEMGGKLLRHIRVHHYSMSGRRSRGISRPGTSAPEPQQLSVAR